MEAVVPDLATAKAVYNISPKRIVLSAIAWLGTGLLGFALALQPLLSWGAGWSWFWIIVPATYCVPLGLLMTLAAAVALWQNFNCLFLKVWVFPEGFAWRRPVDRVFCKWQDVEVICNNSNHAHHGGRSHGRWLVEYSIRTARRRCLRFGHQLDGAAELGRTIEEQAYPHMLSRSLAAYRAGDRLDFGRIKISDRGVWRFEHVIAWEEIVCAFVDADGWVTFERRDKPWPQWIGVSPNKVQNLQVLLGLLRELSVPTGPRPAVRESMSIPQD
jgi:hypothetical protein